MPTPLDDRIIGVTLDQIRAARLRCAAAGLAKYPIISAALHGRWLDILVVDATTAEYLAGYHPPP